MKKLIAVAILASTTMLSGCLVAPVIPPTGAIFADFKAPLDYTVENTEMGSKSGRAETMSILGLVAMGDASLKTAADNGSIKTVTAVDYEYFNICGIIQRYTTVAYGE